jgi:O-antigen biosynthesis protein WbqP
MSYLFIIKRIFDLILAAIILFLLAVPMLLIALVIKLSSEGPVLYWSDRVGINNTLFKMPKFRTMRVNTPAVATHLLKNPDYYITPIGSVLRAFSLDELPQLFSIISGDMAFVGPRPALFNQYDLIESRMKKNVHILVPGVTGWAQINGRDNLPIPVKVEFDEYYVKNRGVILDVKILFSTVIKVMKKEGVWY